MTTTFILYLSVTLLAIVGNSASGVASIAHLKPILAPMAQSGVPESWLTFPIGTLKTAGAAGLLLGLIGVPLVGAVAAGGLVVFFVCALYTHVMNREYSPQFVLAIAFFALAVASLVLVLANADISVHNLR